MLQWFKNQQKQLDILKSPALVHNMEISIKIVMGIKNIATSINPHGMKNTYSSASKSTVPKASKIIEIAAQ